MERLKATVFVMSQNYASWLSGRPHAASAAVELAAVADGLGKALETLRSADASTN